LRAEAESMDTTTGADRGHRALLVAEHARMTREGEVAAWSDAVSACREMNEPYPLAYALLRHAEALAAGHDLASASAAAREALGLARDMGAAPLAGEIEALARRARLRTAQAAESDGASREDAVPDEIARLGL